jgi:hypothetical protein
MTVRGNFEIVLPRRVVPQPMPFIASGGDCGACVLAGLLDLPVAEIYPELMHDKAVEGFSWHDMRQALYEAQARGLFDRIDDEVPSWHCHTANMQFGRPASMQSLAWFSRLLMAVDAGYYAICSVNQAKAGPDGVCDHWVLIVGARERRGDLSGGAARIYQELLVSCSARSTPDEEWVEVNEFLRTRGGFNALLCRPTKREATS